VNRPILAKYRTYGELYRGLCTVTGEIPIAIYRTEKRKPTTPKNQNEVRLVFAINIQSNIYSITNRRF
jgi:hypothetical protein